MSADMPMASRTSNGVAQYIVLQKNPNGWRDCKKASFVLAFRHAYQNKKTERNQENRNPRDRHRLVGGSGCDSHKKN